MHASPGPFFIALAVVALCAGCQSSRLEPHRALVPILIDGDPSEWGELIVEVEDLGYDFGYANDDEFLYLCLITDGGVARRQALAGGIHLWFDPSGGEARVVGLHYPLGVGQVLPAPGAVGSAPAERIELQSRFEELAAQSFAAVEILSADGVSREVPLERLRGVEIDALLTSSALTVELKVPLREVEGADLVLATDAAAPALALELFVPELAAPSRPAGRQFRGAGGGMQAGRGAPGGGRGGPMGGRGPRGRAGAPGEPAGAKEIQQRVVIPLAFDMQSEANSSR